jgi:hypothetical protein
MPAANPDFKVLLQDFAKRARQVAKEIHQPPRSNAVTYPIAQDRGDEKLRDIEDQLLSVADAIEKL